MNTLLTMMVRRIQKGFSLWIRYGLIFAVAGSLNAAYTANYQLGGQTISVTWNGAGGYPGEYYSIGSSGVQFYYATGTGGCSTSATGISWGGYLIKAVRRSGSSFGTAGSTIDCFQNTTGTAPIYTAVYVAPTPTPTPTPIPTPTPTPVPTKVYDVSLTNSDTLGHDYQIFKGGVVVQSGYLIPGNNATFTDLAQRGDSYVVKMGGVVKEAFQFPTEGAWDNHSYSFNYPLINPFPTPTPMAFASPDPAVYPTPKPTPTMSPAVASPLPTITPQPSASPMGSTINPDGTIDQHFKNSDGSVTTIKADGTGFKSSDANSTDYELRSGIDKDARQRDKEQKEKAEDVGKKGKAAADSMVAPLINKAAFAPAPVNVATTATQPNMTAMIANGSGGFWSVGLLPWTWMGLLGSWEGPVISLMWWLRQIAAWAMMAGFMFWVYGEYVDPVFAQLRTVGIAGADGGAVGGVVSIPVALVYLAVFVSIAILTSITWITYLSGFVSFSAIYSTPFTPAVTATGGSLVPVVLGIVDTFFPYALAAAIIVNTALLLTFKPLAHVTVVSVMKAFVR